MEIKKWVSLWTTRFLMHKDACVQIGMLVVSALAMGFLILKVRFPVSAIIIGSICLIVLAYINTHIVFYMWILFSAIGSLVEYRFRIFSFPELSLNYLAVYFSQIGVLILTGIILLKKIVKKERLIPSHPLHRPLAGFLLWALVSPLFARMIGQPASDTFLFKTASFLYWGFSFLGYYVVIHCVTDKKKALITAVCLCLSAVPVVGMYIGIFLLSKKHFVFGYDERIVSVWGGVWSNYLLLVLSLIVTRIFFIKKWRLFFCICALMLIFALCITFIRSTLIPVLFMVPLVWLIKKRYSLVKCITIMVVIYALVGMIVPLFDPFFMSYVDVLARDMYYATRTEVVSGVYSRVGLFYDSLTIVQQFPLFGIGFDWFRRYTHLKYFDHMRNLYLPHTAPHNEYLSIAVHVGIPGLIFFLWFLIALKKYLNRTLATTHDTFTEMLLVSFKVTFVCYLISSFAVEPFWGNFSAATYQTQSIIIYFWILLGLVIAVASFQKKGECDTV